MRHLSRPTTISVLWPRKALSLKCVRTMVTKIVFIPRITCHSIRKKHLSFRDPRATGGPNGPRTGTRKAEGAVTEATPVDSRRGCLRSEPRDEFPRLSCLASERSTLVSVNRGPRVGRMDFGQQSWRGDLLDSDRGPTGHCGTPARSLAVLQQRLIRKRHSRGRLVAFGSFLNGTDAVEPSPRWGFGPR